MRHKSVPHLIGLVVSVIYLLHLLSVVMVPVLRTILLDIEPYALSKEELAVPSSQLHNDGATAIPKIIHQVYLGFDNKQMPLEWEQARQSCIDLHHSYEYRLWTNESVVDFLRTEYPWFLETWMHYRYDIQRADSIRYFILAQYGGIYLDLDNGCRRNLDPLLSFQAWMPATQIQVGLTNHVMGTKKGHPYFQLLINRIQAFDHNYVFPYLTIMNSAGPHFVSMVWEEYLRTNAARDEVRVLMQEEYKDNECSFFTKEVGGGWYTWDHELFGLAGRFIPVVSVFLLVCICAATFSLWWIGWRLAVRTRAKDAEKDQSLSLLVWQKSD